MKTIEILVNAGFGEIDKGGFWQWPKSLRKELPDLLLEGDNLICWSHAKQTVLHSAPVYSLFPQGSTVVDEVGTRFSKFQIILGTAFASRGEGLPELNWTEFANAIQHQDCIVE